MSPYWAFGSLGSPIPGNPANDFIRPNATTSETSNYDVDFLSNGFKLRNTDIGDKEVTFTYNKVKHTFRLNADEASKLINLYEKMSDVIIKYKQPVEADFFLLKNSFFKIVEEYKQVLREIASKEILNFKWSNCSRVEFEGDNTNIVPASIMYEVNTVNNIVEANNNIKNISKVLIRSIDKTLSKIKEKTL